jgi:uncharacterized DUF497 family protein
MELPSKMPSGSSKAPRSKARKPESADDRFNYGEDRVYAIGLVNGLEITVIYADRETNDERRIVSAWRSEPHERRRYWQNIEA